mmetsp:Transcript_58989/g.105210  ORF Transcript_58989/g.105210 Transcript_58989/m.105210 type:complete len:474 (-) Transcript_58989:225-1646(-)
MVLSIEGAGNCLIRSTRCLVVLWVVALIMASLGFDVPIWGGVFRRQRLVLRNMLLQPRPQSHVVNVHPSMTPIWLTSDAQGRGGLSNTVGVVNVALQMALTHNYTFVFPPIQPPAHGATHQFKNLFAKDARYDNVTRHFNASGRLIESECTDTHVAGTPPFGFTQCPLGRYLLRDDNDGTVWAHPRPSYCFPSQFDIPLMDGSEPFLLRLPFFRASAWHFNYTNTRKQFQDMYHELNARPTLGTEKLGANLGDAQLSSLVTSTLNVKVREPFVEKSVKQSSLIALAVHVRLGELSGRKHFGFKSLPPSFYLAILELVFSIIPATCVDLQVLTDTPLHKDVITLKKAYPQLHVPYHGWSGQRYKTNQKRPGTASDFHSMVHADLLVASNSGFSRLAAVLSRNVVLAPTLATHPLEGFSNILLVESGRDINYTYVNYATLYHVQLQKLVEKFLPVQAAQVLSKCRSKKHRSHRHH